MNYICIDSLSESWKNRKQVLVVIVHFISSKEVCFISGQRQLILKNLKKSSSSLSINFLLKLILANLQFRKTADERKA